MSVARNPALDAGALSLRMQVLEPVATNDGMGGETITFTQRRSVWAAFEPETPAQHQSLPVVDALARGTVSTRIGLAPPPGWRLSWSSLGSERTVEVMALERGNQTSPFDMAVVAEVAP